MIKITYCDYINNRILNEELKVNHFPDNTLLLKTENIDFYNPISIDWRYENDAELFTIICLAKKAKSNKTLYMAYCPHARMDRCKTEEDTFTLKYFAEIINSLNFDSVFILDPHSSVSEALIDNIVVESPKQYIDRVINENFLDDISLNQFILFFPDEGCVKRLLDMFPNYKWVSSQKKRDWASGKILGLNIIDNGIDLAGKTVLMCDDIVSYGGSFKYAADKLKELGTGKIYAYATHTENSVLDKEKGTLIKSLEDGTVEKLFTTNSLFSREHEKIEVMEV